MIVGSLPFVSLSHLLCFQVQKFDSCGSLIHIHGLAHGILKHPFCPATSSTALVGPVPVVPLHLLFHPKGCPGSYLSGRHSLIPRKF